VTDLETRKVVLAVLQELDNLLSGCEKCITQPDDLSGCFSEWVLDTEAFRRNLSHRIEILQSDE